MANPNNSSQNSNQPLESKEFITSLRTGIWFLGNSAWLFGITDRTLAALSDGYFSAIDLIQLSTAAFFFVSWLFLKPDWRA